MNSAARTVLRVIGGLLLCVSALCIAYASYRCWFTFASGSWPVAIAENAGYKIDSADAVLPAPGVRNPTRAQHLISIKIVYFYRYSVQGNRYKIERHLYDRGWMGTDYYKPHPRLELRYMRRYPKVAIFEIDRNASPFELLLPVAIGIVGLLCWRSDLLFSPGKHSKGKKLVRKARKR